jgi:hypothetical protein
MGDAAPAEREHVLCLLPFEYDEKMKILIRDIEAKHPNSTFEYHAILFTPAWQGDISVVPEGDSHDYINSNKS